MALGAKWKNWQLELMQLKQKYATDEIEESLLDAITLLEEAERLVGIARMNLSMGDNWRADVGRFISRVRGEEQAG